MKVLFSLKVRGELRKCYQEFVPENIDLIFPTEITEEILLELASDAEVLIAYQISQALLERATKLKHIQVPWTGSERLDFGLLKQYPHISVSNSHSNSLAIAEHAVSLLLAASKRITYRDSLMRKGDWSTRYNDVNSYWLTGKTLGVIGYGAIGKKAARILKNGFDMQIFAIKRYPKDIESEDQCDFIGGPDDLSYVLQKSDFILVSLPLTKETRSIIGKAELELMKDTAIIVNISRGAVIHEQAIYEHLKSNKKVVAALDVWYNYPKDRKDPKDIFQNYPFEELENVVMSPHSSFKISNREKSFTEDIITNISLISEGKPPINQLNLDLGY
ncbi:MAG: 2-hydroxyacid dehydrogenase [Candidatus Hodarchaeales archaeon]|jgi:phosphoglycerate dehydrogenase-like enzyme